MDRPVQRELEITGSVTTELQLTALRWALRHRKTRQADNAAHREAGEKIETARGKSQWRKKMPRQKGRWRNGYTPRKMRRWGREKWIVFSAQEKKSRFLSHNTASRENYDKKKFYKIKKGVKRMKATHFIEKSEICICGKLYVDCKDAFAFSFSLQI